MPQYLINFNFNAETKTRSNISIVEHEWYKRRKYGKKKCKAKTMLETPYGAKSRYN